MSRESVVKKCVVCMYSVASGDGVVLYYLLAVVVTHWARNGIC